MELNLAEKMANSFSKLEHCEMQVCKVSMTPELWQDLRAESPDVLEYRAGKTYLWGAVVEVLPGEPGQYYVHGALKAGS